MLKLIYTTFLATLLVLFESSCDSDLLGSGYVNYTINGKAYKENISSFLNGSYLATTCTGTVQKDLLSESNKEFDFSISLVHFEDASDIIDFTSGKKRNFISSANLSNACDLDLVGEFKDNLNAQNKATTLQSGSATIQSVKSTFISGEADKFRVIGTFAATFAGASGQTFEITGNFNVFIKATDI